MEIEQFEEELRKAKHKAEEELQALRLEMQNALENTSNASKKEIEEAKGVINELKSWIDKKIQEEIKSKESKESKTTIVTPPDDTEIKQEVKQGQEEINTSNQDLSNRKVTLGQRILRKW